MARKNEFDACGLLQGHHEVCVCLTGDAEYVFDAFFFQALDEQIGRFH